MSTPRIEWVTTNPAPGMGMNAAGGWKQHAIRDTAESDSFEEIRHRSAVCGLWARYGWGGDLFITDKCARCTAIVSRLTGRKP